MRKQFMITTDWITTDAGAADDATLGAWVRLHAYCAPRLNGGRIVGAKAWTRDTAPRVCGVARRSLDAMVAAGVAQWDGEDLVLLGYDGAGETLWQKKSHGGKTGRNKQLGVITGDTPTGSPRRSTEGEPQAQPQGVPESVPRGDSEGDCESENEIAPVAAATEHDDRTLKFIRSLGGYLTFKDEDKRPDWLSNTYDMTMDQIREVFDFARSKGQTIILPGKGPGYFGGVRDAMRAAARKARVAAQEQAEAAARANQEQRERSGKEAEARAKEQANRAKAGAILAVYDEDPARWCEGMTTKQAAIISDIRTAYTARRPLALVLRHLEDLPWAMRAQAEPREAEFIEISEGATP